MHVRVHVCGAQVQAHVLLKDVSMFSTVASIISSVDNLAISQVRCTSAACMPHCMHMSDFDAMGVDDVRTALLRVPSIAKRVELQAAWRKVSK